MIDNTESAQENEERRSSPNSDASQSNSGQQASQSLDLDSIVKSLRENDEFLSLVDERAERRAQSTKDRRIDRIEKDMGGFAERLDRYEQLRKEGRSPEQARQQLEFEDDRAWLRNYREKAEQRSSTPERQGSPEGLSDNLKSVLTALKIDADNPEVVKALSNKSYSEAVTSAVEISNRLRASSDAIDESQIAPPRGGSAPKSDLDKEFAQKMRSAQGQPRLIRQIKQEYRQKGVNVDGLVVRVE